MIMTWDVETDKGDPKKFQAFIHKKLCPYMVMQVRSILLCVLMSE